MARRIKRIIDGRIYDTGTATSICKSFGDSTSLGGYPRVLYRTPRGRSFIFHDCDYRYEIEVVDERQAMQFFETHGDPDEYQAVFGHQAEVG